MPRVGSSASEVTLLSYSLKERPEVKFVRYEADLSKLRDPMNQRVFPADVKDGRHPLVQKWIQEDERVDAALKGVEIIAHSHIRIKKDTFVSIGFYDPHGKWISPAVVEFIAGELDKKGYNVAVVHRSILDAPRLL